MVDTEVEFGSSPQLTADMVREQLELLTHDETFRSSKRCVSFLKYVVEQTLGGSAVQIKERTIGVEVFGRDPSYDTNLDHIVRTAAVELRKRLAAYYDQEKHRSELRMRLVPGSYIPRFALPAGAEPATGRHGNGNGTAALIGPQIHADAPGLPAPAATQEDVSHGARRSVYVSLTVLAIVGVAAAYVLLHKANPQDLFWEPVLETPGSVLVVVGDHPNGPPTLPATASSANPATPVPSLDASRTVPFADTVTIARVVGELERRNKKVAIRRGDSISFSDLRQGAAVLIGAFNNEWSLRLTQPLRFSLAMDPDRHLIYIRDEKNPAARNWSWGTNQPREPAVGVNSPSVQDFALISLIRDSETGHVVMVVGGLYTYGTEAAGEFLTDADLMRSVSRQTHLNGISRHLQIVLETTVTDGIPGPPKVVAASAE